MHPKTTLAWAAAILVLTLPQACGGGGGSYTPEDMTVATEKFKLLCATCHGLTGKGDGPAAPKEPKPRSFADKEWQASVNDDHIFNIIRGGGGAVGKNILMPGDPTLTDGQNYAMIEIVRSFGRTAK